MSPSLKVVPVPTLAALQFLMVFLMDLLMVNPVFAQDDIADGVYARGMYNWIHTTGDAELAFEFYHRVFDSELARSTFAGRGSTKLTLHRKYSAKHRHAPMTWYGI